MKKLLRAVLAALGLMSCYPPIGCVARGSRIRVPGGTKRIEEIEVGDEVICVDPHTGELHTGRVSAVRSVRRECVRLGDLVLTSDHPVWSPEGDGWFPAGDWALGTRRSLAFATDDRVGVASVKHVERYAGIHEVFDLTVEHPLHNFVAEGVLVHNKPCSPPDGGLAGTPCSCADGGQGTVGCLGCSCE